MNSSKRLPNAVIKVNFLSLTTVSLSLLSFWSPRGALLQEDRAEPSGNERGKACLPAIGFLALREILALDNSCLMAGGRRYSILETETGKEKIQAILGR